MVEASKKRVAHCDWCNSDLYFLDEDVEQRKNIFNDTFFKVENYIECPRCGHEKTLYSAMKKRY